MGIDRDRVNRVVAQAISGPAGVGLVVRVFAGVPGVLHSPAERGLFSRAPERVTIGDWRYEVSGDGRLQAAHVVGGIVIGQQALGAAEVGPHIARALDQLVARHGEPVVAGVEASLEALAASSGF